MPNKKVRKLNLVEKKRWKTKWLSSSGSRLFEAAGPGDSVLRSTES